MNQVGDSNSASQLAASLAEILSGKKRSESAMFGRRARLYQPGITQITRHLRRSFTRYLAITGSFGQSREKPGASLVGQVDTIITGIGVIVTRANSKDYETAAFIGTNPAGKISKGDLDKLVLGDIGGLLIGKPGADAEKSVGSMRVGSVSGKKIFYVSRGPPKDRERPVWWWWLMAWRKAEMILEVIQRGYVNETHHRCQIVCQDP